MRTYYLVIYMNVRGDALASTSFTLPGGVNSKAAREEVIRQAPDHEELYKAMVYPRGAVNGFQVNLEGVGVRNPERYDGALYVGKVDRDKVVYLTKNYDISGPRHVSVRTYEKGGGRHGRSEDEIRALVRSHSAKGIEHAYGEYLYKGEPQWIVAPLEAFEGRFTPLEVLRGEVQNPFTPTGNNTADSWNIGLQTGIKARQRGGSRDFYKVAWMEYRERLMGKGYSTEDFDRARRNFIHAFLLGYDNYKEGLPYPGTMMNPESDRNGKYLGWQASVFINDDDGRRRARMMADALRRAGFTVDLADPAEDDYTFPLWTNAPKEYHRVAEQLAASRDIEMLLDDGRTLEDLALAEYPNEAKVLIPLFEQQPGFRNPDTSDLKDVAFNAGKEWGHTGSWDAGVSNANVRRYGFVKWWNNTLTPAMERQVRKSAVERAFYEGYKIGREKANQGFRERGKRNPQSHAKADRMARDILARLKRAKGPYPGVLKSIGDGHDLFVYRLGSLHRDWKTHQYGVDLTSGGQKVESRVYQNESELIQGLIHGIMSGRLSGIDHLGRASNPTLADWKAEDYATPKYSIYRREGDYYGYAESADEAIEMHDKLAAQGWNPIILKIVREGTVPISIDRLRGKRNPDLSYLDVYNMGVAAGERYKDAVMSKGFVDPTYTTIQVLYSEADEPGMGEKFAGGASGFDAFREGFREGYMTTGRALPEPKDWGKRNPESSAADLYESFHGKPSEEVLEIGEEIHYHENLAGLGVLTEIKVDCFSGYSAVLKFDKDTQLCSNEEGTQLYIIGGDQSIDLKSLKFSPDEIDKEQVAVGVITEITYNTEKSFHKFKPTDYYHALGEESGHQPILTYDTRNQLLTIAGGAYKIKPEGIVN
jgi:hypothetical protein